MKVAGLTRSVVGAVSFAWLFLAGPPAAAAEDARPSRGLVVVAEGDSAAPASALARTVYADPGLLPPTLDEARARALAGGALAADASSEVRDLAQTRAALHGDDAPTRSLLGSLAASLRVKGVVLVEGQPGDRAAARVFVAATGAFDPVVYESDPAPVATWGSGAPAITWSGTVAALRRGFAEPVAAPATMIPAPPPSVSTSAPPAAPLADKPLEGSRPFYASPWFWGAIGAAVFAGTALFFATRDASDPNIQLSVQVPK